ncbi:MAG TPA: hypothetical protein VGQ15_13415 [Gaiellaceae bacterium]|nr:hypothetical protein [Gaiellaceae bacterium]
MSDLVPRDELRHALETRRELGPDYEDEVADAFIAKLEQRLDRRDSQLRRRRDHQKELILGAMGISIPLLVIAGVFGGIAGIALVCGALAVIAIVAGRTT